MEIGSVLARMLLQKLNLKGNFACGTAACKVMTFGTDPIGTTKSPQKINLKGNFVCATATCKNMRSGTDPLGTTEFPQKTDSKGIFCVPQQHAT